LNVVCPCMATITMHAALRRLHGFLDRTQQDLKARVEKKEPPSWKKDKEEIKSK